MKGIHTIAGVGIIAVAAMFTLNNLLPEEELQPEAEIPSIDMIADDAIYAPDQPPGSTVVVPVASLKSVNGWAIIRETADDGGAGDIIGSSDLIAPGSVQRVNVLLNRESIDGESLYAMLYADNGDGIFSTDDQPLRDASGNISTMLFRIDATFPPVE